MNAYQETLSSKIETSPHSYETALTNATENLRGDVNVEKDRLWDAVKQLQEGLSQMDDKLADMSLQVEKASNKNISPEDIGEDLLQAFVKPATARKGFIDSASQSRNPSEAPERVMRRPLEAIETDDPIVVANTLPRHVREREESPNKRKRSPTSTPDDEEVRRRRGRPKKIYPSPFACDMSRQYDRA